MSVFRHPHLTRGIVHTPAGQFFVSRGLVEMPDDAGARLGWAREEPDEDEPPPLRRPSSPADLTASPS
jgi:hypothetical protein